jgi:hypothetical protein
MKHGQAADESNNRIFRIRIDEETKEMEKDWVSVRGTQCRKRSAIRCEEPLVLWRLETNNMSNEGHARRTKKMTPCTEV